MKKQNIKKVTIASLFTGAIIASGLGLGISLANSNVDTNNNLSNVLLKEGTNNTNNKIVTVVRTDFNMAFAGDITTWGLGDVDAVNVDASKPAWNAETGVFTIPNYVKSLSTEFSMAPGSNRYGLTSMFDRGNPWIDNVKEIRFQDNSKLKTVGSEVFNFMEALVKVYFPQPDNMHSSSPDKIVFHNGLFERTQGDAPSDNRTYTITSNFSLGRFIAKSATQTGSTPASLKPSNDVEREIVYPANMRFALINPTAPIENNISKTTPTPSDLIALGENNYLGIFNNTIVSNRYYEEPGSHPFPQHPEVEPTSINPLFFTNVTISIPNVPEIVDMFKFCFDKQGHVVRESIWFNDVANFYEVTGTTTGEVTNYVPATSHVITPATETSKIAAAQTAFANKYAPNSTEYAIFNATLNSSTVNQADYLNNLNNDWNRVSHLMSGFNTIPELAVISNRYINEGPPSPTPANSIFSYNANATGINKMEYTSNLVGTKGYLVNDTTDGGNYYRALKTTAVEKEASAKWEPYVITEEDKIFDSLQYRSPDKATWNFPNYDYTTKHKLTGDPIFNNQTNVLTIPEYITEFKDVPNSLSNDLPFGTPNTTNYSYLWESTKNSAQVIKFNDFLPNAQSIETIPGVGGQLVAKVTKFDSVLSQLKTIGNNVFSNFTALKTLELPKTLTSIGTNLVANSSALTSATLPSSLTSLGKGAFADTPSLTRFTMPSLAGASDTAQSAAAIDYTDMFLNNNVSKLFIPFGDLTKFNNANHGGITAPSVGNIKFYKQNDLIQAGTNVNINNNDYKELEKAAIAAKGDSTLIPALQELMTAFNDNYPTPGAEGGEPTLNLAKKRLWFTTQGVNENLLTDEVLKTLKIDALGDRIQFTGGTLDATITTDDTLLNFKSQADTKLNTTIDGFTFKSIYNNNATIDLGSILNANSNTPVLSDGGGTNVVADTFGIIFAIVGGIAGLILIIALIFIIRSIVLSKRKALESSDESEDYSDSEE